MSGSGASRISSAAADGHPRSEAETAIAALRSRRFGAQEFGDAATPFRSDAILLSWPQRKGSRKMLFLLATLAASTVTPSVVRIPESAPPARCGTQLRYARSEAKTPGLHRLGEEPPAKHYLAVDRTIGGCPAPAVLRTGIGR
jgi:hypothetical protein